MADNFMDHAGDEMRHRRPWRITRPFEVLGKIIKYPFKVLVGSGLLFRAFLTCLLFLPAVAYYGRMSAAYGAWRRTPKFAETVLGAGPEIQKNLLEKPRWLRRLTSLSYSLGQRVFLTGSVFRVMRNAVCILFRDGASGIIARLHPNEESKSRATMGWFETSLPADESRSDESLFSAAGAPVKRVFPIVPRYADFTNISRDSPDLVQARIAVHLHVFYFDLLDEFIARLENIPSAFDLFVSIPDFTSPLQFAQIEKALRDGLLRADLIVIKPVPNRGRDLAPLIVEFGEKLLSYDIVGHFHTKKSPHSAELAGWLHSVLDLLLGPAGSGKENVSSIFAMLEKDAKIVYPEGASTIPKDVTGWLANHKIANDVLTRYTDISISEYPVVEFAEGSMMWARSSALEKFLELPLSYEDFPSEPIALDGTLAHALERLVFILARDVKGNLVRLHKGDSILDHRFFEESQDFSKKLVHTDVKMLAYYLPQFHSIPENDEWHGAGFTEWTKVRSANPLFYGHYQQHIPHPNFGYYHLDGPEVLHRQASEMRRAGVHGQIFYHYWFTGKLILERPAQMLLENQNIDMPFCFCWANENWTRRWDGSDDQILLKQDYSADDARAFIRYLIPFFKDSRYIKIEERAVLFIYRPGLVQDISVYLQIWREECEAAGLPRPYVVATLVTGATDPRDFDMDAGVERVLYDWTNGRVPDITSELDAYTPLKGRVFSYESMKDYYVAQPAPIDFTYFRSLIPNWDNTARYGDRAHALHGSTPRLFQDWLEVLIAQAKRDLPSDRQFIIVNAWNEWAEGAHLEADTRYGYAYLNAIGRALSNEPGSAPERDSFHALITANEAEEARNNGAMMMVTHRWGGGTAFHVNDMVKALAQKGVAVFSTRVAADRPDWVVVERVDGKNQKTDLGSFHLGASPNGYVQLLRRLHVRHLHVHHLGDLPGAITEWLQLACTAAHIRYDVTLHDYLTICPRIFMITESNQYCHEPSLSQCQICITKNKSPFGTPSVAKWRFHYGQFLSGARCCFVPNEDVAERFSRYFPEASFRIRPHPEPRRNGARLKELQSKQPLNAVWSGTAASSQKGIRRVAVMGLVGGHKGVNIVLDCARFAQAARAPVHFMIIGAANDHSDFDALDNVTVLGRYHRAEFLDIIERQSPDVAFLPSSCPETYSYTLSETIAAGIYPVVFDLGAMGNRVRSLGWGEVLPAAWMGNPEAVVRALVDLTPTPPPPAVYKFTQGTGYPDIFHDYYDLEWPLMTEGARVGDGVRYASEALLRELSFAPPQCEAALYVTNSPDGSIKPHVRRCISALMEAGIDVYLIIAADLPNQADPVDIPTGIAGVFIRHNDGYDFAAWAHVLQIHPELKSVDILYLVNDAVIGPVGQRDFSSVIADLRNGDAEIYGMTENFVPDWHLQSYFLAIKRPALVSDAFNEFFGAMVSFDDKSAVIENYEIPFAPKMAKAGFRCEALFTLPSELDMTIHHWKDLISLGFPFVKVQAARDKIAGIDRDEVRQFLGDNGYSSDELKLILGRNSG